MAQTQIIERLPDSTVVRTGTNGQRITLPHVLPVLPIRNIVVFPGTVMPLNVGRPKSKALLDEVMPGDKLIGVCTQRNPDVEDPQYGDLHTVGVVCTILKLFKLPAGNLQADTAEKQAMLEELNVEKRLRMIAARLATQLDVLELQSKIQSQVKENIDKSQRRYYLQEQMKAIRKELGEGEPGGGGEIETLRTKLTAAKLPEAVMKEANRELARLEAIPSASPEYGVIRTWLQIVSELPWSVMTGDKLHLKGAKGILDRGHFD